MSKKTCCVTGHRDIPASQEDYIKGELRKEILLAISEGYTHFISGFAEGVDLYFTEIVVEQKAQNSGITLEAAIPYRKRLSTKDKDFQRLIKLCDAVTVNAEAYTGKGVFMNRNKYMVQQSNRVIAVFDGRESGGTEFTIRYARKNELDLRIITIAGGTNTEEEFI